MPAPVLHARELVVARGDRRTIDRMTLEVSAGSIYALLGGNGAGKTTTLNAFLGFVRPASGAVEIDGVDLSVDPGARARLAYLPENVALYPYLSGTENLQYFCALAGLRLTGARARALLDECGLSADAHGRRVSTYSKGMRQKVGLAVAQARDARAMLLDEPTSGLDPAAANDFAQRVVRSAREDGVAVLMATHDLFNARQMADRIGILRDGRLVEQFDASAVDHAELERKYLALARDLDPAAAPATQV